MRFPLRRVLSVTILITLVAVTASISVYYYMGFETVSGIEIYLNEGNHWVNGNTTFLNVVLHLISTKKSLSMVVESPTFTMYVESTYIGSISLQGGTISNTPATPSGCCNLDLFYNLTFSHMTASEEDASEFCLLGSDYVYGAHPQWILNLEASARAGWYEQQVSRSTMHGCYWNWVT